MRVSVRMFSPAIIMTYPGMILKDVKIGYEASIPTKETIQVLEVMNIGQTSVINNNVSSTSGIILQ